MNPTAPTHYQLIAFDMDGTLLTSSKEVLPSSAQAIADAVAAGKDVAICSGRCPDMVEPYTRNLPGIRYSISCSGAVLYDLVEHKILREEAMDDAALDRALDLAADEDYFCEAFYGRGFYYENRCIDHLEDYYMQVYRALYVGTGTPSDDLQALVRTHPAPCVKYIYHFRSAAIRDRIRADIEAEGLPFELVDSEASSLELSAKGISKGTGLVALSKILGIDPASTIAVGDADNDLEALRAAGLGVAMGNANANAVAAADVQVATNDEGGCAEAVYRYLLGRDWPRA